MALTCVFPLFKKKKTNHRHQLPHTDEYLSNPTNSMNYQARLFIINISICSFYIYPIVCVFVRARRAVSLNNIVVEHPNIDCRYVPPPSTCGGYEGEWYEPSHELPFIDIARRPNAIIHRSHSTSVSFFFLFRLAVDESTNYFVYARIDYEFRGSMKRALPFV